MKPFEGLRHPDSWLIEVSQVEQPLETTNPTLPSPIQSFEMRGNHG